jgi:Fur family zinc uptake transcriptional regulator
MYLSSSTKISIISRMKTEEAIGIIKNHGHKYTNKRREMIDIFVEEDKYFNL